MGAETACFDDLEVELAVIRLLEGGLEGDEEFLVGSLAAGPGVAFEGDVIGVGVERGVEFLQFAELAEELAVEGGAEDPAEFLQELPVLVREAGLGQEEAAQVPLADRQGALAVVDAGEPEHRRGLGPLGHDDVGIVGEGIREVPGVSSSGGAVLGGGVAMKKLGPGDREG